MPFQPKAKQPQFTDLITSLDNSRQQTKDNALWQTIYILLQRITKSRDLILDDLKDLNNLVNDLANVTFLTQDNETISLPNSRRLLESLGIDFDDSVFGERTIRLTHYWTPLTDGSETECNLIFAAGEAIMCEVPIIAPFRP